MLDGGSTFYLWNDSVARRPCRGTRDLCTIYKREDREV